MIPHSNQRPKSSIDHDTESILFRQLTLDEAATVATTLADVDRVFSRPDHHHQNHTTSISSHHQHQNHHSIIESRESTTPEGREIALRQLEGAIQLIPWNQKLDYLAAMTFCPHLVQIESDPIRFLRCENYNPWAAASALVNYWSYRRKIFGDRAYRSLHLLTMGDDGALDRESVELVWNGYVRILPNDSTGMAVLQGDSSRKPNNTSLSSRLQANFYYANILSENPLTQMDGFSILVTCEGKPRIDRFMSHIISLYTYFPLRKPRIHFCFCNTRWKKSLFRTIMEGHFRLGLMKLVQMNNILVHLTDNREEMLQTLLSYGLKKEGLPPCLGGTWTFEDHEKYLLGRNSTGTSLVSPNSLYAMNDSNAARSIVLQFCLLQKESTMQELPLSEKRAYLQALEIAPQIVEKESCWEDFLVADDYHVVNACHRLINYWHVRKELFDQRTHLCLSQTGGGALTQADRRILDVGFCMLLPNDVKGRPAVYVDTTILPKDSNKASVERSIFYMLSVASENRASVTDGIVILFHVGGNYNEHIDVKRLRRMIFAFPIQVSAVHLYGFQVPSANILALFNFGWLPVFHIVSAMRRIAYDLESYGLQQSGLPVSIGGNTWDIPTFVEWQYLRICCEWDIEVSTSDMISFPGLYPRIVSSPLSNVEVKRRKEVMYARRQRDRKRVEAGLLQDQVNELKEEQTQLLNEQKRLEDQLWKAQQAVATRVE